MMGSWCGWLVLVGGGFSIWGSRVSGGVVCWRVRWRLLTGGGVNVVVEYRIKYIPYKRVV